MFFLIALSCSQVLTTSFEEKSFLLWMRSTNNLFVGDEYHLRFGIYLANSKYVKEFNSKSKSFKLGLNKFACLTVQEYKTLLGSKPTLDFRNRKAAPKLNLKKNDLPTNFDWREKGAVYDVKDQGSCGSCWAFGAILAQEGTHAIATGELLAFSESNLIDCADGECHGCMGGWSDKALSFVIQKQGGHFNLLSEYPYTPAQKTCEFEKHQKVSQITDVQMLAQGDEENLKEHIATVGPVAISVDCSQYSFQLYTSGIYDEKNCHKYTYNHAMGIVGYGFDDDLKKDYWIVRNSWGKSWGEAGYVRFLRGEDTCNVADAVFYSVY